MPKSARGTPAVTVSDLREELQGLVNESLPHVLENKLAVERRHLLDGIRDLIHGSVSVKGSERMTASSAHTGSRSMSHNHLNSSSTRAMSFPLMETPLEVDDQGHQESQSSTRQQYFLDLPIDESEHLLPVASHGMSPSSASARSKYKLNDSEHRVSVRECARIKGLEQEEQEEEIVGRRQQLDMFTNSTSFEYVRGAAIFLNALVLGVEAYSYSDGNSVEVPEWTKICNACFCILFASEISLRLAVQGWQFFLSEDGAWNVFDLITVGIQVVEHLIRVALLLGSTDPVYVNALRVLCPLRIVRFLRLVRSFDRLRAIAAAITGSMKALFFTLAIQTMTLYSCSIMFTTLAWEALERGTQKDDELRLWFGSLSRTMLTLTESILGGLSWDEAIRPFISEVSPLAGCVFCFYIFFSIFAVLNMVTGVYVEKATEMANQDATRRIATEISDLFGTGVDEDGDGITWEIFESKLGDQHMQEYFKDINVDISQANVLFNLLDVDNSGSVDTDEMVDGLIRLVGHAKALELKLVHYELWRVRKEARGHFNELQSLTASLHMKLDDFVDEENEFRERSLQGKGTGNLPIPGEAPARVRRFSLDSFTSGKHIEDVRSYTSGGMAGSYHQRHSASHGNIIEMRSSSRLSRMTDNNDRMFFQHPSRSLEQDLGPAYILKRHSTTNSSAQSSYSDLR